MPFYKFGHKYVMLYNIQNALCSFCLFCEYWFEIINHTMHYIYMCYKCLACESKMASILNLTVGSSVGCPLNCPLFPYLKVVGCPLSCLLSCPLYPYMEVVGSLICMAKFPWAAHSAAHWAAHFFIFGSSGVPTELPTVSIYGSSGQPNLHGKIPMGSPRAAHSVAHVQPMGSEVGSSPVISVWDTSESIVRLGSPSVDKLFPWVDIIYHVTL